MTPEFDRRSALVLGSPYFDAAEMEPSKGIKRREEFDVLLRAVQKAHTYDDLKGDIKALYDRAEVEAKKQAAEHEKFIQSDVGGYGRFLDTDMRAGTLHPAPAGGGAGRNGAPGQPPSPGGRTP